MGTAAADESFRLKWNDYHTSITQTFNDLRQDQALFDVSLMVDGKMFQAHRIILAACSGVFKRLFQMSKGSKKDQLIMLWDIKPEDFDTLLTFMYEGEVNVQEEELTTFLNAAERLQVRGLTKFGQKAKKGSKKRNNGESSTSPAKKVKSETLSAREASVTDIYDDGNAIFEDENGIQIEGEATTAEDNEGVQGPATASAYEMADDLTNLATKKTPKVNPEYYTNNPEMLPDYINHNESFDGGQPPEAPIDITEFKTGLGFCPYCQKEYRQLRRHVEDRHLPSEVPCTICGKIFSSYNKMQSHRSNQHKNQTQQQQQWAYNMQ